MDTIAPHTSPDTSPAEEVRMYLRRETTPCHEELDATIGGTNLSTTDGYLNFLTRHASAFFPLERCLEKSGVTALMEDWPVRARSSSLQQDLQTLHSEEVKELTLDESFSSATMLGVLYVLEGSRFGNGMLTKMLESANPALPLTFLKHGKGLKLWDAFVTKLNSAPYAREDILSGSMLTFNLFLTAWKA